MSKSARLLKQFDRAAQRRRDLIALLALLLVILSAVSMLTGPASVSLLDLVDGASAAQGDAWIVMMEIRAPRLALAILVGGALGLSGAAAQSLTRNPLADPGIFGAPQAAALGAVCLLYFGYAEAGEPSLTAAAVGGAATAIALVILLVGKSFSIVSVLLAGLAVGSLCGAGVAIALSLSPNPFAMADLVFWLMGSFADRSYIHVALAAPLLIAGAALLMANGSAYRALSLGEDTAASLGFRVGKTALLTAVGLSLTIGAATAAAGSIGFIGLMAPHLVRSFCSGDPKSVLVPAALAGALLTTGSDILVRMIPSTSEIPVGVVTALLGAPFFLYLVTSRRAMFGTLEK